MILSRGRGRREKRERRISWSQLLRTCTYRIFEMQVKEKFKRKLCQGSRLLTLGIPTSSQELGTRFWFSMTRHKPCFLRSSSIIQGLPTILSHNARHLVNFRICRHKFRNDSWCDNVYISRWCVRRRIEITLGRGIRNARAVKLNIGVRTPMYLAPTCYNHRTSAQQMRHPYRPQPLQIGA
jgi:hypothetical protein